MTQRIPSAILVVALIMGLAVFSGCAASSGKTGRLNSFLGGGYPPSAVSLVADDLADALAGVFPPGHTSFHLKHTGTQSDPLGSALEQALRSRGFSINAESGSKALTVAYVLDRVDEETWYSRLSVSSGLTITRTYSQSGDTLVMMATTKTDHSGGGSGPRER